MVLINKQSVRNTTIIYDKHTHSINFVFVFVLSNPKVTPQATVLFTTLHEKYMSLSRQTFQVSLREAQGSILIGIHDF